MLWYERIYVCELRQYQTVFSKVSVHCVFRAEWKHLSNGNSSCYRSVGPTVQCTSSPSLEPPNVSRTIATVSQHPVGRLALLSYRYQGAETFCRSMCILFTPAGSRNNNGADIFPFPINQQENKYRVTRTVSTDCVSRSHRSVFITNWDLNWNSMDNLLMEEPCSAAGRGEGERVRGRPRINICSQHFVIIFQ